MKIHHLFAAMLCAALPILQGCGSEDYGLDTTDKATDGIYASFDIGVKGTNSITTSRVDWTVPQEDCVLNEGKIHDVYVIIYKTSVNDASLPADEKPEQVQKFTFSSHPGDHVYTIPRFRLSNTVVDNSSSPTTHYVMVLANLNNDGSQTYSESYFRDRKLSELRDEIYQGSLCVNSTNGGNASSFDRFTMTSDAERSFTVDLNTEGDIRIDKEPGATATSPIIVERLASRIDVSFGKPIVYGSGNTIISEGTEYQHNYGTAENPNFQVVTWAGGTPNQTVDRIVLPVYDYAQYMANPSTLVRTYDYFVISDYDVLNAIIKKSRFIRSTKPNVRVYFNNVEYPEYNDIKVTIDGVEYDANGWYARNSIWQGAGSGDKINETTQHTISGLITAGNNLYSIDGLHYYTIGYYGENINNKSNPTTITDYQDGKTNVQIKGRYYKANELSSSAAEYDIALNNVIMNCKLKNKTPYYNRAMAFATCRNTIYRLCIDKVLRDTENVYIIWYYDSNNDGTYDKYVTTTPFGDHIVDNNTTPND